MVLNYPLMAWSQRRKSDMPFDWKDDGKLILGQAATLGLWIIALILSASHDDAFGYLVPSVGVLALFYVTLYVLPFGIQLQKGYKIALWMKLVGPIYCIFMNKFKYGEWESTLYGFLMNCHYFSILFAQGMMDQFYIDDAMKYRSELAKTIIAPLSVGLWYVLYGYTSPTNPSDTGFLFNYPIYYKFTYQSLYTMGTWQWVYTLVWLMKEFANDKFSDTAYDLIVGSSMWAYISHYVFIVLSANYFVRPLSLKYETAAISNLTLTWIGIFISYFILNHC